MKIEDTKNFDRGDDREVIRIKCEDLKKFKRGWPGGYNSKNENEKFVEGWVCREVIKVEDKNLFMVLGV
jgi:hypothetical protein